MRGRSPKALALPSFAFGALAAALVAVAPGCNALNGSGELTVEPASTGAPDGGAPDAARADAAAGADANAPIGPSAYGKDGWAYERAVALSSDAPAPLAKVAVLVVLPKDFDYAHAAPNGDDLRFTSDVTRADDLPYFIENWAPGGVSHVWVVVPAVPIGPSLLHAFYGKPSAPPMSSFVAAFPSARRTSGGGMGSFVATAGIDVDWFELRAGDILTLAAGVPLRINARRIIIAGTITGEGRGSAGGAVPMAPGTGPGGGMISAGSGAGGGGYGGAGGKGGSDNGNGGAGGVAHGTASGTDIAMGSGGGTMDSKPAGAGGGALSLVGWRVSVTNVITMDGSVGGGLSGQNSGGGSGGGILIAGWSVDLSGATLTASGGAGGPCAQAANDAGGGGGGGRIKIKRRSTGSLVPTPSMAVLGGQGGAGAGTTAPGSPGVVGTTNVDEASVFAQGVDATLGPETMAVAR